MPHRLTKGAKCRRCSVYSHSHVAWHKRRERTLNSRWSERREKIRFVTVIVRRRRLFGAPDKCNNTSLNTLNITIVCVNVSQSCGNGVAAKVVLDHRAFMPAVGAVFVKSWQRCEFGHLILNTCLIPVHEQSNFLVVRCPLT